MKLLVTVLAALMLACASKYAYISGRINSSMAEQVIKDIDNGATIIYINSPGGFIEPARRIREAILRAPQHVSCIVESRAGSAAFWILQSCQYRIALPKATLMIHNPRLLSVVDGTDESVEFKGPPTLEQGIGIEVARLELVITIAPRLRMLPQDYEAKVNQGDWEMTAEEAFRANAVDFVPGT